MLPPPNLFNFYFMVEIRLFQTALIEKPEAARRPANTEFSPGISPRANLSSPQKNNLLPPTQSDIECTEARAAGQGYVSNISASEASGKQNNRRRCYYQADPQG